MSRTLTGHGDPATYRRGCRCNPCREAKRLYAKRWRQNRNPAKRVPTLGIARRLQALAALGWPMRELADELGLEVTVVGHMRARRCPTACLSTHRRVSELYDRLSMRPGPSSRTILYAKRYGWLPPLAWDDIDNDPEPPRALSDARWSNAERLDEVKVQRTMVGAYRGELNTEERREVVRRLHSQGMNDMEISRRTGMIERTVLRNRLALGLPARQRWDAA